MCRSMWTTISDEPASRRVLETFKGIAQSDTIGTHHLASSAAAADAILFVDLHEHTGDLFQRRLRHHPLADTARRVYVYDQRDRPTWTFPGIYVSGSVAWARRYKLMSGGPYAALLTPTTATAIEPDLLFSFRGSRTHPLRDQIVRLEHPRAVIEDTTHTSFFFSGADKAAQTVERQRYIDTVGRSKFVLCPRGFGASSFRLFETLAAGRVPVIISDEWLPPPGIDWERCALRISERDAHGTPALLEEAEDDWPRMAAAAQQVAGQHFARGTLWNHYATTIADLADRRGRIVRPWWAQRRTVRAILDKGLPANRRTANT